MRPAVRFLLPPRAASAPALLDSVRPVRSRFPSPTKNEGSGRSDVGACRPSFSLPVRESTIGDYNHRNELQLYTFFSDIFFRIFAKCFCG